MHEIKIDDMILADQRLKQSILNGEFTSPSEKALVNMCLELYKYAISLEVRIEELEGK